MKNNKKICAAALCLMGMMTALSGCSSEKQTEKEPIELTVWTYYNGDQLRAFNEAVDAFNATVGKENRITVTAMSLGSVDDLEENVMNAVRGKLGAQEMPDIFSAYADTAYELDALGLAADISLYLTEQDRNAYVQSYLTEGDFDGDGKMKIFPVAKATEVLVVNNTDWRTFAEATGTQESELATIEGMTAAAQRYYEWTDSLTPEKNDGKALFGRDAMANYMIVGAKQLGYEIFMVKNGRAEVNLPRGAAKKLWDNYYIPYIKGYFASSGRFRSDDMKTGNVIAFVGSSAGATFFPDRVTTEDENSYPIEIKTLPAPQFEGGEKIAVQQGAGMVVIKKSDAEVEASVRFLKWFTQSDWSIEFCVGSSYMPVIGEYNDIARIERSSPSMKPAVRMTLETSVQTVKDNAMYTSKAFIGGMTARKALEYSMSDLAKTDRESVKGTMAQGASLEEACAPMMTEEYFDAWYTQLMAELTAIVEE